MHPTRRTSTLLAALALCLAVLALGAPASAESGGDSYYVAGMLGIGGPFDGDLDHDALALAFGVKRGTRDYVSFRFGELDLDGSDDTLADDSTLQYLTISSEFRKFDDFYVSGIFLGIGLYQLDTDGALGRVGGGAYEAEGFGVHLGVNGTFRITRHIDIVLEITGHWADLDFDGPLYEPENLWATAMVGVSYGF